MFRRLLAAFRSPIDPQTAHEDAYNETAEWVDGHGGQYPAHAGRTWGPFLSADRTAYTAGCSAYRCAASVATPIEGTR